ncbi:hypothetical protein [Halorussus salinisoli]|uniref:hypothetical protein n=1 Tax=Halorussus salinisoli TaxID=2558242 RepID=UPI0010C1D069|nr:hypothetical protein [Halorussus salinisoli]
MVRKELNAIDDEINAWKDTYEIESLTELRQSIGSDDLTGDERRERLLVSTGGAGRVPRGA